MSSEIQCNTCNKNSLSILFLRPSAIAKCPELAVKGSDRVTTDATLMNGLLPTILPTQSRFVLRLLRAGYVHIYIENPPNGTKNWLSYRVNEKSDIVTERNDLFSLPESEVMCVRYEHNAMGLKIINIPQAHKIPEIWVAFSANVWNEKLKTKNKANPVVMQKISLQKIGQNSFTPNLKNLRAKVLECALGDSAIARSVDQGFPFNSIVAYVDRLADTLRRSAASHPATEHKEIAVVLRDPVAIAAELNALRLQRNELIKKEIAKPENLHPLNSSRAILGIRQSLIREEDVDSYEQVTPLKTKEAFLKEKWPTGTVWQEVTAADRKILLSRAKSENNELSDLLLLPYNGTFKRQDLGRVIYPDNDARAAAWTKEKSEKAWEKFKRYYNEEERVAWVRNFDARMKAMHYDLLELFEQDWRSAADDEITTDYFKNHFDPDKEYKLFDVLNSNERYSQESHYINTPAPLSSGPVLRKYTKILNKSISDKDAIILRAFFGNHDGLIQSIGVQLEGTPGKDGMRDKTYDVFKGISELNISKPIMASHGWISNALAMYSLGHLGALSGAAFSIIAHEASGSINVAGAMNKLATFSKVQRFMEYAVQGALKTISPKMPILVTTMIKVDEALEIFEKRAGQNLGTTKTRIKAHDVGSKKIAISVLTDTDAFKLANGNLANITHNPASGSIKLSAPSTWEAVADAGGKATILSERDVVRLFQEQAGSAAKLANLVRVNGIHTVNVLKTTDARLALGSMIIQTIGIWHSRSLAMKADSRDDLEQAYLGMLDSGLGFMSGALQLWTVSAEATIIRERGAAVAAASLKIGLLKVLANFMGAAGGVLNVVLSMKKSKAEGLLGNSEAKTYHRYSALAFGGTGATSTALTMGAIASSLEARGIGGAVVQTVAARLGGNAVIGAVGGVGLTVSGIGLVLLGAGLIFTVSAIVLTPNDLQRWLGRCYFGRDGGVIFSGKRDDMFVKGDWASEKAALDEVIQRASEAQKENGEGKKEKICR
jgi:hypothetical protein